MQETNDILYWFLDKSGEIIFSNASFDPGAIPQLLGSDQKGVIDISGKKARFSRTAIPQGVIFLLTFNSNLINSSRMFNEKSEIYGGFLATIIEIKNKIIDDSLHDLTKIHGHNIQEIYNVVPEELLSRNFDKQVSEIKNQIINNLGDVAVALIQIIRNNRIMTAEFDNIRLIHSAEVTIKPKQVRIDPIVQSILYLYDQDFQNKKIKTHNGESLEKVQIDYNFFVGALIPIFENILKYAKDNTSLKIVYIKNANNFIIRFQMRSLKFERNEELQLLSKNYSGLLAREVGKSGKGLGMYHAKRLLAMNKARVRLYFDADAVEEGNFRDNILEIYF